MIKIWTLHERKGHIKKKGRVYQFLDIGKVEIIDLKFEGVKGDLFQRKKLVERWCFVNIYESCMIF